MPRTHILLLQEDFEVSIKRVSLSHKKYRPTPTQRPAEERDNVLEQDFLSKIIINLPAK
ncbi:hypothetical protein [Bacillus sp. 37MA]|uniref:hypothetical protein n=1 Tax=Bacillus sp. 37MA TaxID=1132442 RepID=UPI000367DE83|nr:hypothetical protein [Bacillus sp. 37MA]